ncbi:phosphate acyltransferase PlsX [Thiomonas sp.]|uniref:phosphate acyltransferase PlsX n=1 Tax=Thiomonas sp. TaxID=2047785 RepID=UPI00261E9205|nr:phosphate acyltransferase PlsX [Thiomonas sp.]
MSSTLAVDVMGGDHGPDVVLPACAQFLRQHPDSRLLLVGQTQPMAPLLQSLRLAGDARVQVVAASEVVASDDPVEVALRRKRDSSMRRAIELVRDGQAQACVSAGNTGALMAVARYLLKTLHDIERPAIATYLPNQKGQGTLMLDLGANVDCEPLHLLQFAVMGTAFAAAGGHAQPTVGLLNIGEEVIKGNDTIKRAAELLRQADAQGRLRFYGNVEGNDIFKGTTDIVVCDGFVGNVALKTSEGLAQMLTGMIREEFTRTPLTRLAALLSMPVLRRFRSRVDPRRYNGAALLGLRGLVVKSHGSADAFAFEQALLRAHEAAQGEVVRHIEGILQAMHPPSPDQFVPAPAA